MATAILRDAEVGIDSYANYNYLRNFTPKPMATLETVSGGERKARGRARDGEWWEGKARGRAPSER